MNTDIINRDTRDTETRDQDQMKELVHDRFLLSVCLSRVSCQVDLLRGSVRSLTLSFVTVCNQTQTSCKHQTITDNLPLPVDRDTSDCYLTDNRAVVRNKEGYNVI